MKQKFYICKHCGNLVAMIRDAGVPILCCGEKMHEIKPGTTEASGEKHIPVYHMDGNTVHVTVGSVEHPMTKEHYISFVAYVTSDRFQMVKLYPEGNAQTRLQLRGMGYLYYYCNRHGLFRKKI